MNFDAWMDEIKKGMCLQGDEEQKTNKIFENFDEDWNENDESSQSPLKKNKVSFSYILKTS